MKRTSATPGAGRARTAAVRLRPEIQGLADPQAPPVRGPGPGRLGDGAVALGLRQVVEQQFHLAAAVLVAMKAGRKDPGVVDHQDVVLVQAGGQLPEAGMAHLAPVPLEHQQPGGIPLAQRVLGHQLRRQQVIVILNPGHRNSRLVLENFCRVRLYAP